MKKIKYFVFKFRLTLLITAAYFFIESCSYCPPSIDVVCNLTTKTKLRELKDSLKTLVLEDPGTIIVFHGFGCAESKNSDRQDIIKVAGFQDIPLYATNAMVFLNGWHLKFLHGDHHISGIGTAISNIQLNAKPDNSGKILNWQAAGAISDNDFNDPYQWCYFYTVIAWNSSNLNLTVDQRDGSCDSHDHRSSNFYSANNDFAFTSLSSFGSYIHNSNFASSKTATILPRGFGFSFKCRDDHHLLQIGYNLDHSEKFIEKGKNYYKKFGTETPHLVDSASYADSGFVTWETYSIYKDNDTRRDYLFGEIVSALGGNDLSIIQPPYSILPKQGEHFDIIPGGGIHSDNFTVENIRFKYAVPVLTGWNLEYMTDDQHVSELGVWIDNMQYDKDPNLPAGTLHYNLKSIMVDQDGYPDIRISHKANILEMGAETGLKNIKSPDLIPFSPLGNAPSSFCRLEENGNFLRVTVKNQGNADAGASKTKVTYNSTSFILDTPPIPAGGSVDLLFRVPANCFSPDCSFQIMADSENQVEELNKQNNSADGGCTG